MQRTLLARKYAAAYLNVHGALYTKEHIQLLEQLVHYVRSHKEALFYLKLSCIHAMIKKNILLNICARYGLHDHLDRLLDLLIAHKRLFMIIEIFDSIVALYKERNGIMEWVVRSAAPLQPEECEVLYRFLENQTGKRSDCTSALDKRLLAGIRIQSTTLLWEYSVRQQLAQLTAS